MISMQRLALAALALAAMVLAPIGGAFANGSIGQYLVGNYQDKGTEGRLWNPTGHEAIAVYFAFGSDVDDGEDCDYSVIPAKGSDEMDFDFNSSNHRFYVEVISVPTMGGHQGKIIKDYGIGGRWSRGNWLAVADANKYQSRGNTFIQDCVCDALDDAALPDDLFKNFGINCPK